MGNISFKTTSSNPVLQSNRNVRKKHLAIIDDDNDFSKFLKILFADEGYLVDTFACWDDAKPYIENDLFDAILLDLFLESKDGRFQDGRQFIEDIHRICPYSKVIVMTAHSSLDKAIDVMRLGATSFIEKTSNIDEIVQKINELIPSRTVAEPMNPDELHYFRELGLIGESPSFLDLISRITRISHVSSTVLIVGESGTGKELVAKAVHDLSPRKNKLFYALNCGAIPANLLESELFGHKRGSFTDAKADRVGIFKQCNGGTLFLDEITELPLTLQVKLLRVLQDGMVQAIGADHSEKVDVRIIAATNRPIEQEVKQGRFREDLYYRLSVLRLHTPSLKERIIDIPILVRHFIDCLNEQYGKSINYPDRETMAKLIGHAWPGNIRELRNAVERAMALSDGSQLRSEDLFLDLFASLSPEDQMPFERPVDLSMTLSEAKYFMEGSYIRKLLASTRGNISEASRISGVYRPNLYRLLDRHNISPSEFKT